MMKLAGLVLLVLLAGAFAEEAEDAAYLQMRRTACLVLSRYHSNTQKELVEGIVQSLSPDNQPRFINKMYAVAVETCEAQISQSEVQEFYVENNSFDPTHLFYLLSDVNYNDISSDLEVTKDQESIVKFAKKFDEEMQIRQEEKEAKQQEEGGDERYEMKFLGLSLKDLPESAKLVYLLIFAAAVAAALYWGFNQIDDKKEKSSNKRRKSPKKEQKKE